MASHANRTYRLLEACALGAARLDASMQHSRRAATQFLGALLTTALDTAEMSDLTVALYGLTPSRAATAGLDRWEREWYAASLPPAPARVLVTAAGTGREVVALRRIGYSVDAFEPAAGQATLIAAEPGDLILRATYDDLVHAQHGDVGSPAAPLAAQRYDAVILGWGSFTHVLERRGQLELLSACHGLCPEGPILLSFWAAVAAPHRGRVYAAGRRLGQGIQRFRCRPVEAPSAELATEDIGFAWNVGFTRRFSREDIHSLAAAIGRGVALYEAQPYAHATLTVAQNS